MTTLSFATGQPFTPVPGPETAKAPAQRKRGTEKDEARKSMLAKVHVAKKQLGMKDDEYRAMLNGMFEVESSKDLTPEQMHRFLIALAEVGFKGTKGHAKAGSNRKKTIPAALTEDTSGLDRTPLMRKIEALLAEKGRVEGTDVPWKYAVKILMNQTGGVIKHFDHATPGQLRGVIAALTRDAKRKGRVTHVHSF